jgi:hypothetical protein
VAADNVNIIKLLPALICGQEEIDYFVAALDDVLKDAHSGSGLLFEFGRTMANGALRRSGKLRPSSPYDRPTGNGHGNGNGNGNGAAHGNGNGNGAANGQVEVATSSSSVQPTKT